jgi:hypothetical protein
MVKRKSVSLLFYHTSYVHVPTSPVASMFRESKMSEAKKICCREGRLGIGSERQPMDTNAQGALFSRGLLGQNDRRRIWVENQNT